ncbi:MAG TPA: PAS domain-containing protein [Chryseosolibacter sp.]|nr:PAS domain-containing protein [Chryseosolibacter sp.]
MTKDITRLKLHHLNGYAAFLLQERLEEFVKTLLTYSYELEVPLLKFFGHMGEDEIFQMSLGSNSKLLTALKDNQVNTYVTESTASWINNQLPIVRKEQVIVDDISLVNYARKKALRAHILHYTSDIDKVILVIDEVDQFILMLDSVLYKTFLGIQQERLADMNSMLQKRERELLEAQAIGQIGSFEWDMTGNNRSSFTPEIYKILEFEETSTLENFLNDVHSDDRAKVRGQMERAMHTGNYQCEYRYLRRNKFKILDSRGKVIFENGKPLKMIGTITDVTEKNLLINKLKENEALSNQSQLLTKTGNWKWTIDKDEIEWSDEMYRIYGLAPQSERITFQRFLTFIHDDDRNRRIAEITEAVKTGVTSDYIMRIVTKDGKEKVLRGKGQVLLDKSNVTIGILGTCQDITNEHNLTSELKLKNDELLRKNRDLESFNFIASHDLQEPLRKIQIYSNRFKSEGVESIPPHMLRYLEKISHASNRMQKMIEDFLVFYQSLHVAENIEKVDLNELIREIQNELSINIQGKQASITSQTLPLVSGIRIRLKQMFKHFISNAVKFSKPGMKPEIHIFSSEVERNGKRFVNISVKDNGIGFEPKYAERIFELFQRLNSQEHYSGTGIGLSLCKKIAEDHDGIVTAQSQPGIGSVFSVELPTTRVS